MQKATGESFYGLSRLVQKISIQLILEHPLLYARNVALGWYWFWKVPVYWSAAAIDNPMLVTLARGLILIERGLLFGINMIFIFGSIALVVALKKSARWCKSRLLFGSALGRCGLLPCCNPCSTTGIIRDF